MAKKTFKLTESKLSQLINEVVSELLEYKSYDTNLGKITPDDNNKSIYFDKYNELDKNKFAKFLELLKKNGYEFNVLKTSSITIIEFEEKFNWKNIEKIIKGI